jgi:adenylate cyclase
MTGGGGPAGTGAPGRPATRDDSSSGTLHRAPGPGGSGISGRAEGSLWPGDSSSSESPGAGDAPVRVKPPTPIRNLVFTVVMAVLGMVFALIFVERMRGVPTPPAPAPARGSSPAAVPKSASIAILPFVNMSPDPENEYFSDGMTEELINALAKVQGLKIPARTTVFAFKGKSLAVQEVGQKLGVSNVLEGSVRKAGDRIRINVQLVATSDGSALWSEEYDREMKDVFAIQDEISRKIVDSLKVKLTPSEEHAIAQIPTHDTRAYEFYLKGRRYFYRGGARNYQTSKEMFLKAQELDPKYPLAYAGLADVASFQYMYSESTPRVLEQANSASEKALELAPDLAESHASRGLALSLGKEYAAASKEFENAIRLDPKLFEAYYFYGRNCFAQGQMEQAAHLFEQAMKARPEDYQSPALLVGIYGWLGRIDDAKAASLKTTQLAEAQLQAYPDDTRALYLGAGALIANGQREKGLDWTRRAVAVDPTDTGTLYNVACIYSRAGMQEEAMGYLEKAVANGFAQKAWIENDDDLASLRDMPRYKTLLAKMR